MALPEEGTLQEFKRAVLDYGALPLLGSVWVLPGWDECSVVVTTNDAIWLASLHGLGEIGVTVYEFYQNFVGHDATGRRHTTRI